MMHSTFDKCSKQTDKFASESGRALPATVTSLGDTLSVMYRLACCAWGCAGGDHQIEWLAGRVVNHALAAHRLIRVGLYDESLVLIRGIGEIANLLWLFKADLNEMSAWKAADPTSRLRDYSPFQIRKKLEQLISVGPPIDRDRYKRLCEIGTHPVPGLAPGHYTGSGRPILGGYIQPVGVYVCTTELGYAVSCAAFPIAEILDPPSDAKLMLLKHGKALMGDLGTFNVLNFEEMLDDLLKERAERVALQNGSETELSH